MTTFLARRVNRLKPSLASISAVPELLTQIVATKPGLAGLPVIANVDFGHTTPILTFPVGGTVELRAVNSAPRLTITSH